MSSSTGGPPTDEAQHPQARGETCPRVELLTLVGRVEVAGLVVLVEFAGARHDSY